MGRFRPSHFSDPDDRTIPEGYMPHSTSVHDFNLSLAAARADTSLKNQLIRFLKTNELSEPNKSELVSVTCNTMTWVIQEARNLYVRDPQRLVAAVSASEISNAIAIWGATENDWIIVSEGLMRMLIGAAEDMSMRLTKAFPELFDSELGKKLQAVKLPAAGFRTAIGAYLYFAAISFFTGHEAGHHLAGHDGYFNSGAHAEAGDEQAGQEVAARMTEQALECEADKIGIRIYRSVATKLLCKLVETRSFTELEQRAYQRILAILISAGAMMAVVRIKPRDFKWIDFTGKSHPPAAVRITIMAAELSAAIMENFNQLDDVSRRWIRVNCLEVAACATIDPGTKEDKIYQEWLMSGDEPAAIRTVGIERLLNDTQFKKYRDELDQYIKALRPKLRPRMKAHA